MELELTEPGVRGLRVVVIGGGTGLVPPLTGLKHTLFGRDATWLTMDRDRITAVVAVSDDGGSSGRLRRQYPMIAPGDIRNCLIALADCDPTVTELFRFRFQGESDLGGHSLGNLILAALTQLRQDSSEAVEYVSELLRVRGRVLPCTTESATLLAELDDGLSIVGESSIAEAQGKIRRVSLDPPNVRTLPQVLRALEAADLIILGPGSLYTSIIPVLLVADIAAGIAKSSARVVLVNNLMTEPGETDDYTASDVVAAIRSHAPEVPLHAILLHCGGILPDALLRYAEEGAYPLHWDADELRSLGVLPIERQLIDDDNPLVHHDPLRLAEAILELAPTCQFAVGTSCLRTV